MSKWGVDGGDEYAADILQIPADEFDPRVQGGRCARSVSGCGRVPANVDITWPFNGSLYGGFYNLMIKRPRDVNSTEPPRSEAK